MLSLLLKGDINMDQTHIIQDRKRHASRWLGHRSRERWEEGEQFQSLATMRTCQAAHRVAEAGKPWGRVWERKCLVPHLKLR